MEPKIIKSDSEYRSYLSEVERLALLDPKSDSTEGERLALLALLIEEYEKSRFRFEAPTPLEAIQFRMNEQGLRQADLVPYFGSRSRVSEVLAGKRPLTVQMIREVSAGLGIPADVLVASQSYTESEVQDETSELDWKKFPAKEMERRGYFEEVPRKPNRPLTDLARDFVMRVVSTAGNVPALTRQPLRGNAVTPKSKYALLAWKVRVVDIARKRKTNESFPKYRFDAINSNFLSQLVHLSWLPNGVRLACELIEGVGIPVIVQPHLTGTHLDGAALLDHDGEPVIGLTLRFDRIDYFWFTLLHELVHVMKHLSAPGDTFVDRIEDRDATEALELEANRLAKDALIPRAAWRRAEMASAASRERILRFAKEHTIHPAIVAGRVRRETGNFQIFGELLGANEVRRQFPTVTFE